VGTPGFDSPVAFLVYCFGTHVAKQYTQSSRVGSGIGWTSSEFSLQSAAAAIKMTAVQNIARAGLITSASEYVAAWRAF
jgi:hypothetical protein